MAMACYNAALDTMSRACGLTNKKQMTKLAGISSRENTDIYHTIPLCYAPGKRLQLVLRDRYT